MRNSGIFYSLVLAVLLATINVANAAENNSANNLPVSSSIFDSDTTYYLLAGLGMIIFSARRRKSND